VSAIAVRARLARAETAVPALGFAAAAATVAVGEAIRASGARVGGYPPLGVVSPPVNVFWHPKAGSLAVVSIVVLAAAAALTPAWIWRLRRPPAFAVAMFALALALDIGLNLARGGVHELYAVFQTTRGGSPEAGNEYLLGLPALDHGVRLYVGHFASAFPALPQKVTGNPPGPLVALQLLGIRTPQALAALCIGTGALTAPLAYDLGRTLGGEARGRVAGVLTAFAPSLLLWGATSADYAFATLGLVGACLLARKRLAPRALGALAAAAATFFSWLLFAIPAWAVLVAVRRGGPRQALVLGSLCAGATLAVYGALALTLGYDPFAALSATDAVYRHGIAQFRPYPYWLFGSPTAWVIALGLPIAWAWLRAAAARDPAALALAAIVLVAAVLGFTKAETERIWLPLVPLACVAAACAVPARRLRMLLWLLVFQALAVQLLFDTIW
jgi:hypothetical protein